MSTAPSGSGRAPRFELKMPLKYRVRGQMDWYEGTMQNISRSGMLFWGARKINPHTPIEMSFVLPVKIPNEPATQVVCAGHIVRTIQPSAKGTLPGLAARIWDYRLIPGHEITGG